MATIIFYPNNPAGKTKIHIRLKIGRITDIRQSTRLTIKDSKTWNKDRQLPNASSNSNKDLRKKLRDLRILIEEKLDEIEKSETQSLREINGSWLKVIILKFTNEELPTSLDLLVEYAQYFTDSLKHRYYKRQGVKYIYSQLTINKYQNITRQFREYQDYLGKEIVISNIDEQWANTWVNYLTYEKISLLTLKGNSLHA